MKKRNGLSLIELVVYLAVIAVVLVVLVELMTRLVSTQRRTTTTGEVAQNLNYASQRIVSSINNATAVSGTFPSNRLDLVVDNQPISYILTDGQIIVERGANSTALTSGHIKISPADGTEAFVRITNGSTSAIELNLKASLPDGSANESISTLAALRGIQ